MSPTLWMPIVLALAAYFVGATPFGFLVAYFVRGIDIRTHGSGNIGATNVGRVLGSRWGGVVFVLDFLKGSLPVLLLPLVLAPGNAPLWRVTAGIATILGHMFPCWLGFRGGKGVATGFGVVVCLAPVATLIAGIGFAIAFGLSRIVSLSSLIAALLFAVAEIGWLAATSTGAWDRSLIVFALVTPLLIVVKHRSNIARLVQGTEPRYEFRPGNSEPPPASAA